MRLEDAILFVVFDGAALSGPDIPKLTRDAIGVGADMVAVRAAEQPLLQDVAQVCREFDALFIGWDDPAAAQELQADGIHLSSAEASIGEARAYAGVDGIVGMSTGTAQEAMLAAEVGADYIVHSEGLMCPSVFAQLRGSGLSNLYASGLASVDEAREVVGNGVFRVCVEIQDATQAGAEVIAEYSRLFGRVI